MNVNFKGISGEKLIALLSFIHGTSNWAGNSGLFVRVTEITPKQERRISYDVALEFLESYRPNNENTEILRVGPEYFLKVYGILNPSEKDAADPNPPVTTEKYPPIQPGTKVWTTKPNKKLRSQWDKEAWAARKWGVFGNVITHHDSHGLCYEVQLRGSVACYDPTELEVQK